MAEAAASFHILPGAARFAVRGGDVAVTAIGSAFGVVLPRDVCRATSNGLRSALWLGPDEWLLLAPEDEGVALNAAMATSLGDIAGSIVVVSDRNVAIEVRGTRAADVVNGFNPLDLHPDAFPVGMCTRTIFAKAEIVLWRTAANTFRIEVWWSFAPYVLGLLGEAVREYAAA